jgi:hypothetical protein
MREIYGKHIKWLVVLLMVSLIFPGSSARAASFSDVNTQQNGWAYSSIQVMADKQILIGYQDGTFQPGNTVSKAEWTAMIHRLFDTYRPNKNATGIQKINGFSDVPADFWAYKEISDIYNSSFQWGVYGLTPDGQLTFRPDTQLSRLQLANMLYSMFDTRMIDRKLTPNDVCSVVSGYKDIPAKMFKNQDEYDAAVQSDGRLDSANLLLATNNSVLATYFMGSGAGDCGFGTDGYSNAQATILSSLQTSGIMTATADGYFRPLDKVTRAEAVTILNRIYNYLKKSYWLSDYSTIDLEQASTGSTGKNGSNGTGTGTGTGTSPGANPGGTPDSRNTSGGTSSSQTAIKVRDYFKAPRPDSDSGVITKNVRKEGEIETAVTPMGYGYLTIELVSQDKGDLVDLYVITDDTSTLYKQESFPMTIPVSNVQQVGLRTKVRDTNPLKKGGNVFLSVKLSMDQPAAPAPASGMK